MSRVELPDSIGWFQHELSVQAQILPSDGVQTAETLSKLHGVDDQDTVLFEQLMRLWHGFLEIEHVQIDGVIVTVVFGLELVIDKVQGAEVDIFRPFVAFVDR